MADLIDLKFGLWTRVGRRKHKFDHIHQLAPMCFHGIDDWTVRLQWRCGLMSNYFGELLLVRLKADAHFTVPRG